VGKKKATCAYKGRGKDKGLIADFECKAGKMGFTRQQFLQRKRKGTNKEARNNHLEDIFKAWGSKDGKACVVRKKNRRII